MSKRRNSVRPNFDTVAPNATIDGKRSRSCGNEAGDRQRKGKGRKSVLRAAVASARHAARRTQTSVRSPSAGMSSRGAAAVLRVIWLTACGCGVILPQARQRSAAIMGEWSFLSEMLDKVESHSTIFGKVWMSVLFVFRIFILAAGVDRIWGDEQANMDCNTKSPGCKNACYDASFPVSHTRFWVLQILTVSTPTFIYLGHVLLVIRRENKLRRHLQQKRDLTKTLKSPKYSDEHGKVKLKGFLLFSYLMQLLLKILLEAAFVAGQYFIYGSILMPEKITFRGGSCMTDTNCFISRPTEKNVFIVFMLAMAVFSVMLNITEISHLMILKLRHRKRRGAGSFLSE